MKKRTTKKITPLWKGPSRDGITYSMLSRFICCRERFRLMVVHGYRSKESFSHYLEYGQMWHTCEEAVFAGESWQEKLKQYAKELLLKYSEDRTEIDKWYSICKTQFPIYLNYWKDHTNKRRKEIFQEMVFDEGYLLPSGRIIRLRGKWDSAYYEGSKIFLQENKSKGDFNEQQIAAELHCNLQTGLYTVAADLHLKKNGWFNNCSPKPRGKKTLAGVVYNIVRRPLARGTKHSISQRKGRMTKKGLVGAETTKQYYERLGEEIAGDPDYFFVRLDCLVHKVDIEVFKQQYLNPQLEALCDWWELVESSPEYNPYLRTETQPPYSGLHWTFPGNVWNPILENRSGLDPYREFLQTGSTKDLRTSNQLFSELID